MFQTISQKQEVDIANADVLTRRENILSEVSSAEERISVLGERIRDLELIVVEKEEKAKKAIEDEQDKALFLDETLKALSFVEQSKQEEEQNLVQIQLQVSKSKEVLEKLNTEIKKQEEENQKLKEDLLSLQRANGSAQAAAEIKMKELNGETENKMKDIKEIEKTIELFYEELKSLEGKKIADNEEMKAMQEIVDDKKKYLAEMEDSVAAAEQKYAGVISTGEKKLKELLTAIEMNAVSIDEKEAALLKKENTIAQKEVWLSEKENTLRNIKIELEKFYNKPINHVII